MTFKVSKLPFAVLLDEAGIIRSKGLVNSREHLESLSKPRSVVFLRFRNTWVSSDYER